MEGRVALQHVGTPAGLRARVDPARGGKIVSLRDPDGSEWLVPPWRDPAALGPTFGTAEMAGWDECAPTITACEVDGAPLPDHGDLWDAEWEPVEGGLRVTGSSWPYRLERSIAATPTGGLRLDYAARNLGDRPLPFLWAAHPQFAAPPGTAVVVEPSPSSLVNVLAPEWPTEAHAGAALTIDDVPEGGARKVYVAPDERARGARLERADGAQLRMTWSAECRYLGLWFDHGAWGEQPVIAIEPSTGFADSLAVAVRRDSVALIPPRGTLRWWLRVEYDRAGSSRAAVGSA